jgi:hypothetical protein
VRVFVPVEECPRLVFGGESTHRSDYLGREHPVPAIDRLDPERSPALAVTVPNCSLRYRR